MDFLGTRALAYFIGAFEFGDNIRINVLDRLRPYTPQIDLSWERLQGKVLGRPKVFCASQFNVIGNKSLTSRRMEEALLTCCISRFWSKFRVHMQTCIITGGNAGIGLETAKAITRHRGRVIIACRSLKRGQRAAQVHTQLCA